MLDRLARPEDDMGWGRIRALPMSLVSQGMDGGDVVIHLSFGGGLNSTAVLVGLYEHGETVDVSLFADTGRRDTELPETYANVDAMSVWSVAHGFPEIITVRVTGESLEENCLRRKALPSIAYGYKTCSQRWKIEPQQKFLNNWQPARDAWSRGEKVQTIVGFDADESHRTSSAYDEKKYTKRYPLVEWGWGREECAEAIRRQGLPVPPKSSCYFCPNRSAEEFKLMRLTHPEYLARAIALEDNADLTVLKGLKRDYSLRELIAFDEAQLKMFDQQTGHPNPCGCIA